MDKLALKILAEREVTPHIDVNYYWRERMRVHVPIVTQPTGVPSTAA